MIDSNLLMSVAPLTGVGTPAVQTLPPPQSQDVMRFDDVMTGKVDLSTLKSTNNDQSVLQIVEPNTGADSTSFKDVVIDKLSGMDKSYSSILQELKDRPQFNEYLNQVGTGDTASNNSLTYPTVETRLNNPDDYQAALQDMHRTQTAALAYQQDTTTWTFKAQMWSTTVNLASAVVNQVAQGFKTLFRASG